MTDDPRGMPAGTAAGGRGSGLRVSLLGPMRVESGGRTLHVAGPQRRRLLAVLAVRAGRVVPVEALIDAMWGDDPPPSAAKTVQSHVVRLRRSLAEAGEAIETTPGGYRLNVDAADIDIERFDKTAAEGAAELRLGHVVAAGQLLETAVALWRGPALVEVADADFAVGARTRLEERRLTALEDLAEARLASGGEAVVIPAMERLVAEDPGRERAWALLMRALYASGRQHDALVAFQRARTVLGDEYGLEPGAELRELEQRILDQDPTLSVVGGRSALPAALRDRTPLVGRDHEVSWLRAAWALATKGGGQVRAVLGPSGVGRTRLVAELAASAQTEGGAVEYVSGAHGLHLLADGTGPGSIIDAIATRCRAVPLLLIVDDVDWTPPPSLDAIRALAMAAERMMLLLVLIGHGNEGPGGQLIRELEGSCATSLDLAPLQDADIASIVIAEGLEAHAVSAVGAAAKGLPGLARREAALWAERTATENLQAATSTSIGAYSAATAAGASVLDEVLRLVEARQRWASLLGAEWLGRQPYRSLASYEPTDSELFVGRERLVAELTARVLDRRLVAVIGASGTGKSSLVRAGLLPLVRSGRLPGGRPWRAHVLVPGREPLAALDAIDGLDEPGPQLVVIDQFEEVAATGSMDVVAARLIDLVLDPALDVHIVLVVRADQLGGLATSRTLAELIEDAHVLVPPPSDEELRRIVTEPARRTGCVVEPELVSLVSADVAGHEAALPLVSAAMAEVWERRDGDTLLAQTYRDIGGLASAIERLGDRALEAVGPDGHDAVRDVMLRLVDLTDDGAWVRRRLPLAEVPAALWPAVDALVDARLVARSDQELDVVHEVVFRGWARVGGWLEEARADLTLERDLRVAARSWDLLGRHDDSVLRSGRLQAAAAWAARQDVVPPQIAELLDASRAWAERDDRAIREQLRREQRGRRRLRRSLLAASVLLVLAILGSSVALVSSRQADSQRRQADSQRRRADSQRRRADASAVDAREAADRAETAAALAEQRRTELQTDRLVAESAVNLDRDAALSMLLAVEAWRRDDTPATRGALLNALTHHSAAGLVTPAGSVGGERMRHLNSSLAGLVAGPPGLVFGLSVSEDGQIAAAIGQGEVLVYDTEVRALIGRIETPDGTTGSVVREDGAAVLITGPHDVWMFDTGTGKTTALDLGRRLGASIIAAFFVSGGAQFVLATDDHRLTLYDSETSEPAPVALPESPLDLAGVTPDGTIAIGTATGLLFWDPRTNSQRTVELDSHGDADAAGYAFSSDMRWLAEYRYQGEVLLWDLSDGRPWGEPANRPGLVRSVAFDPDDPSILTIGSANGTVTMFDVIADRPIGDPLRAQVGGIRALAYSANGSTLVTSTEDGSLGLWVDEEQPNLLSTPLADEGAFVAASVDGRVVVTGVPTSVDVRRLDDPVAGPVHISLDDQLSPWVLSDDGSMLAVGGQDASGYVVLVFDTTTGDVRLRVEVGPPDITVSENSEYVAPAISADGSRLAVAVGDARIEVWDVDAQQRIADLPLDAAELDVPIRISGPPTFRPDGQHVAIALFIAVLDFDVATGTATTLLSPAIVQGPLRYVGAEGVVGSGVRGQIRRWDLRTGTIVAEGHSADPTSLSGVAISADDSLVASAHPFTSAFVLFDGDTLAQIGDPVPAGIAVGFSQPVLSADGRYLYANDVFDRAARWDVDPDSWVRVACRAAGRNVTRTEFSTYFGAEATYRATCDEWPVDN